MAEMKRYRVTGGASIVGESDVRYQTGEEFAAAYPPEQEAFLLEVGHLVVVSSPQESASDEHTPAAPEASADDDVESSTEADAEGDS